MFSENNCKTMSDYLKVDTCGYNWLLYCRLLNDFKKRIYGNISNKESRFKSLNKEERIESCCKVFSENNCKTMSDYLKVDINGYKWLIKNHLQNDFKKRVIGNFTIRESRFKSSNKEERIESCCKMFSENNCKTMSDYLKVDTCGYRWLRLKGLLAIFQERLMLRGLINEFQNRLNIKPRISRFKNLSPEQGLVLCIKLYAENCCKNKIDYKKVDPSGYRWLLRKRLYENFCKSVNVKFTKRLRNHSNNKED